MAVCKIAYLVLWVCFISLSINSVISGIDENCSLAIILSISHGYFELKIL